MLGAHLHWKLKIIVVLRLNFYFENFSCRITWSQASFTSEEYSDGHTWSHASHPRKKAFLCQSNSQTFTGVIDRLRKITFKVKSLIWGSHFHMTGDEVRIRGCHLLKRVMGREGRIPRGH